MNLSRGNIYEELRTRFPPVARVRGRRLQVEGAVSLERLTVDQAFARVRGVHLYDVSLGWDGDETDMYCNCPGFIDDGPCKHIWALIEEVRGRTDEAARLERERPPPAMDRVRSLSRTVGQEEHDPWGGFKAPDQQLRYVIDIPGSASQGLLALELRSAKRRKDGAWGQARKYDPYEYEAWVSDDPLDQRLLATFAGARDAGPYANTGVGPGSRPLIDGPLAQALIVDLCATGRLDWKLDGEEGGPLAWDDGPTWRLRVAIEDAGDERELVARLERDGERMSIDEPLALFPFGLLLTRSAIAPFDARGSIDLANELRSRGRMLFASGEERDVVSTLANTNALGADLAAELGPIEAGVPIPHLYVETGEQRRRSVLGCTIHFDYADIRVSPGDPRTVLSVEHDARMVSRNPEAERLALERFFALGGRRGAASAWHEGPGSVDASRFPALAHSLLAEGWNVEAEGLRWRLPGKVSISISSGIDWFELDGSVDYGGQQAALPELLKAAREGRDTVQLGDGTIGVLPERWLERWSLLAMGKSGGEAGADKVRFRNNQAFLIDALLAKRAEVDADEGFERLRDRLLRFEGVEPAAEPRGFRGELRQYQREGLGWLRFLETMGLGGCLADDMGLGKTVQVLAFLEGRRAERLERGEPARPSLVVAPRSLIFNWIDEAAHFTPQLTALDYTGSARKELRGRLNEVDMVVTTYGTLRRDAAFLSEFEFDCAVLDEAQAIKNASSQTAKAARLLRAHQRLALSGTPIENHLGELWSLFEFLNPGMLGSSRVFSELVGGTRSQAGGSELDLSVLAKALRPFFLRRRKEEVLDDLPPKTEQELHCELGPDERRRYNELRMHYRASLLAKEQEVGLGRMKMHVLEALLRLRQASCHPGLLDKAHAGDSSAKIDVLIPRLEELAENGKKALVFSQFTSFLAIVRARLDATELPYEYLDGSTIKRKECVERFQNDPDCPLFLISLKAGGHGLNLTAADYVFLLDPWWNPAAEAQAVDRAHRIGRTRPVMAYRLIAKDTIEERVQELQASKRALAKALFDEGGGGLKGLTSADLEQLLAE